MMMTTTTTPPTTGFIDAAAVAPMPTTTPSQVDSLPNNADYAMTPPGRPLAFSSPVESEDMDILDTHASDCECGDDDDEDPYLIDVVSVAPAAVSAATSVATAEARYCPATTTNIPTTTTDFAAAAAAPFGSSSSSSSSSS